jgi:RNA polymerase sigma-70 factor, ECF subfamily
MATETAPGSGTRRAATAADVRAALAELTIECRQALAEIHFGGRSAEEAAEVLGVPVSTVIARTYQGLRQLRDAVDSIRSN